MHPGRATPEGTARFRERFADRLAAGHFRRHGELWLSSIGLGSYLGSADAETDAAYESAVEAALAGGVNVFDTAINYRHQRSERAIGSALRQAFSTGQASRDEIFVSTKAGFLAFDGEPPVDAENHARETWLEPGLLEEADVARGHALSPRFLADQLDRSRANLGLETVDLFYLHNPEGRLEADPREGLRLIEEAIAWTGEAKKAGLAAAAGLATWNGLRVPPATPGHLPLAQLLGATTPAAGIDAIQLPVNLAMPEALAAPTQDLEGASLPALVVARHAGLTVFASASILQGRLARGLPPEIAEVFPDLATDAQRALQFTRSTPGVTTALVGMSTTDHVHENLEVAQVDPAPAEELQRLFAGGV